MKNQGYKYDPNSAVVNTTTPTPPTQPPPYTPSGTTFTSSGGSGSSGGGFTASGSSSGSTGFGITGGGFTSGFDETSDFPDWLQNQDMHELEDEYQNLDFNIGPMVKPIRRLANAQYSNALQQGANAADEAIARAFQTGIVGPINTSMISAQTAMPALLAKMGAEKDIAGLRIQNMYKEQEARAALAAQIATMRQNYVNTMAQYALGEDKLSLDAQLGFGALDIQRDQLDFQMQQYDDRQSAQPTYGELANIMAGYNGAMGSPQSLSYWQQFGSGLGEFADDPVAISFGGAASPSTSPPPYTPEDGWWASR
jgi:hypothetical protein